MNAAIDQQCDLYIENGLEKLTKINNLYRKEVERPHYQGIYQKETV
jgi:hypothetical protein